MGQAISGQNPINSYAKVLPSAERTANTTSDLFPNPSGRSGLFYLNVSAITDSGASITMTIQGYDELSNTYYTILAGAAVSTAGATIYPIHTDLNAASKSIATEFLPKFFRL